MSLKIVCSGHLIRHPVGGHSWHHLQYLIGFMRLGHEVTFFEDYGWANSCYDPSRSETTPDPDYGVAYMSRLFQSFGLEDRWCYLAEDGTARGMSRAQLTDACRESDIYFNLSNINWIPELDLCRRRVLVDTDPVFTQIGAFGMGGPFSRYDALFTYGENVHRSGCEMPTGDARWLPTRQPVVLDLWDVTAGDTAQPLTAVMNWTSFSDTYNEDWIYGQKDREFKPYFSLPRETGERMRIALHAPVPVQQLLAENEWELDDPLQVTRDPFSYQEYIRGSRAEFGVAKHGYVSTRCGWFSDRSSAYLAMGRPVVIQDTGFSDFLPCGEGLLAYRTKEEAIAAIRRLRNDYNEHCRAARKLVEEHFDSARVLTRLLEDSL
jgi:hypothetical protein